MRTGGRTTRPSLSTPSTLSTTAASTSTSIDLDVLIGTSFDAADKIQDMAKIKFKHLKELAKDRIKFHGDQETTLRTQTNGDPDKLEVEHEHTKWWHGAHQRLSDLDPSKLSDALKIIYLDEFFDAMFDMDRLEEIKKGLEEASNDRRHVRKLEDKAKETVESLEERISKSRDRVKRHYDEDLMGQLYEDRA